MYYVSESNVLNSSSYQSGSWVLDTSLGGLSSGNYYTKVDTRSLSITSTGRSSDTGFLTDSALLYYENPTGGVSALLQHGHEWVDVTSQGSQSLPDEFRNAPGFNSSKTLYNSEDVNAILSPPFTSGANWTGYFIGALFYSPPNASSVKGVSGDSIVSAGYEISPSGPGNFSTPGNFSARTHCVSPSLE